MKALIFSVLFTLLSPHAFAGEIIPGYSTSPNASPRENAEQTKLYDRCVENLLYSVSVGAYNFYSEEYKPTPEQAVSISASYERELTGKSRAAKSLRKKLREFCKYAGAIAFIDTAKID